MPEGQRIDCLEEAEFCRMRNGKCGIDDRTSGIDGMLSATHKAETYCGPWWDFFMEVLMELKPALI